MDITREIAVKVLETVDAGLVSGMGTPLPGRMCVEAAVCYAMGLPHGDEPTCVDPALRHLKIRLNDSRWASPQARAAGMRRLALAQLGSAGHLDAKVFAAKVVEMTIRTVVPLALRAESTRNPKHAEALEAAAVACERNGDVTSASRARDVVYAASAADAASVSVYAADAAAAERAAAAARDRVLADFAERVVQILAEMDAPGVQWLDLAPLTAV